MNETSVSGHDAPADREEKMTALFAHLVMQQANMAMMLMGKVAHPETGKAIKDLEAAKLFIDQLEMLEAKTKGNLSKEEADLLKQSLMNLRLTFVEAVEETSPAAGAGDKQQTAAPHEGGKEKEPEKSGLAQSAAPGPEETHKRFTKKY